MRYSLQVTRRKVASVVGIFHYVSDCFSFILNFSFILLIAVSTLTCRQVPARTATSDVIYTFFSLVASAVDVAQAWWVREVNYHESCSCVLCRLQFVPESVQQTIH